MGKEKLDREIAEYERETGMHRSNRCSSAISFLSSAHSFNTTKEDMDELQNRVNKMEGDIDTIGNKIDAVLGKMESMGMDRDKKQRFGSAQKKSTQQQSDWDD